MGEGEGDATDRPRASSDAAPARGFDLRDPLIAATLLTRVPVPVDHDLAGRRAAAASWAHPIVGAALGGCVGGALAALAALGVPDGAAAAAAVAIGLALTGALHEDGLADCADGFGGGWTVERRLEIMRDSRIGAFGAAALALAILAKWSLIGELGPGRAAAVLAAAGALSRAPLAAAMRWAPPARAEGLGARAGRPGAATAVAGVAAALAISVFCVGAATTGAALAAGGAAAATLALARAKIGGVTGDVLGASVALAELAALAVLAA